MEPNVERYIIDERLLARVEARARRLRAQEFDRLILKPVLRALASLRHRRSSSARSRRWSPGASPCK
jgi:hypothetical protein